MQHKLMEAELAEKPIFEKAAPTGGKKPAPAKVVPLADKPLPIIAAQPAVKAKPLPPVAAPVASQPTAPKVVVPKATKANPTVAKPQIAELVQLTEGKAAKPVVAAKPPVEPKPFIEPKPAVVAAPAAAPAPVAVNSSQTASPVPAAPITEGKEEVTETFTTIENKAQNFTADAATRVKSVMEKGSKGVEELVEFSKGNLEAVVASGRVAAKGAEEMAKYAADYGRSTIEKANATAKQFAGVKSPTEFFQLQSEMAKSSLDAFVGEASKFGESYMKLLGDIAQPIQGRYALAVEKVKTAVSA